MTLFDFLSLKNNVNVPVPSKLTSRKNCVKKLIFLLASWRSMTKIAGSRSRIRIHWSEAWIRGSGSGSTPKCHGSGTLAPWANYPTKLTEPRNRTFVHVSFVVKRIRIHVLWQVDNYRTCTYSIRGEPKSVAVLENIIRRNGWKYHFVHFKYSPLAYRHHWVAC